MELKNLSTEQKEELKLKLDKNINCGLKKGQLLKDLNAGRKSKATKSKVYLSKMERRQLLLGQSYEVICDVCNTNKIIIGDKTIPPKLGRQPFKKPIKYIEGPMHTKKLPDGSTLKAHEMCVR